MYMDAEERKAELMKENRVQDGMMFKLDFDPRIIGSKKLPDGTIKKGVGNFIRDWSLDEFPQFLKKQTRGCFHIALKIDNPGRFPLRLSVFYSRLYSGTDSLRIADKKCQRRCRHIMPVFQPRRHRFTLTAVR